MRVLGLAFPILLAITVPNVAHANGSGSNMRPGNAGPATVVRVWDGGGSGGHSGTIAGYPTAGRAQQWNRGPGFAHRGPNHQYGGPSVPTYWVFVPGSAVFDYPFADWRGPTGGWGNP
jgi:hypothetical protein